MNYMLPFFFWSRIRAQLLQLKWKLCIYRKCSEMYIFYAKNKVRNLGCYFQSEKFYPLSSHNCQTLASYSGHGALISVSSDLVWDLLWMKWRWRRFVSEFLHVSPPNHDSNFASLSRITAVRYMRYPWAYSTFLHHLCYSSSDSALCCK
jgi:hypothetical protein